jgi:hypothetical protein
VRTSTEWQLDKTAPTEITIVTVDVYNIEMTGNFTVYFKRKYLKISRIKMTKPQQLENSRNTATFIIRYRVYTA